MKLFDITHAPVLSTATSLTHTFTADEKAKYSEFNFVSEFGFGTITMSNGINSLSFYSIYENIPLSDSFTSITVTYPTYLNAGQIAAYTGKIVFIF